MEPKQGSVIPVTVTLTKNNGQSKVFLSGDQIQKNKLMEIG